MPKLSFKGRRKWDIMFYSGGAGNTTVSFSSYRASRNTIKSFNGTVNDLTIDASKTSGPAPLGVTFDLTTSNPFLGVTRPLHECSFWFDFGDSGATFSNISSHPIGNNANLAKSPWAGHVWDTAGTYTVTAYVYHKATNQLWKGTKTITVSDADTYYPTTKTICYSPTADYTNAPTGATTTNSWTTFRTTVEGAAYPIRALVHAGETHTISQVINRTGNYDDQFGVYDGTSANLVFPAGGVSGTYTSAIRLYDGDNAGTIWGWNVTGDYDPTDGSGEHYEYNPFPVVNCKNATIWRCSVSGTGYAVGLSGSSGTGRTSNALIQDCNFSDWANMGIYHANEATDTVCVVRGNSIKQNASAVLGIDGKQYNSWQEQTLDGSTLTWTANKLRLFGDVANAFVGIRDQSTNVITQLTYTTDYTITTGSDASSDGATDGTHQIVLVSAGTSGDSLVTHMRHYADHGPIRSTKSFDLSILQNDMYSHSGWTESGTSIQSCLRINSDGTVNSTAYIAENKLVGGDNVIVVQPANTGITQYASDTVIDGNYFEGLESTNEMIQLRAGGVTIRNNSCYMPNLAKTQFGYGTIVTLQTYASTDSTSYSRPIRMYNNTSYSAQTSANGARTPGMYGTYYDSGQPFTDIDDDNNIAYDSFTTGLTDYTPLDASNYYRPQSGSAALNSGTAYDLVWDDFFGDVRDSTPAFGSGENIAWTATKPVITSISTDTGTSSSDFATSDTTLSISGTAAISTDVTFYHNGSLVGSTTSDGSGNWTYDYTGTTLEEGNHVFYASVVDANNGAYYSDHQIVQVILTAPAAPVITLDNDPDEDLVIYDPAYTVSGVVAGNTLEYSDDNVTWSETPYTVVAGSQTLYVRQTDLVGNVSAVGSLTFTYSTTWSTDFSTDTVGQLPADSSQFRTDTSNFSVIDDSGTNRLQFVVSSVTSNDVGLQFDTLTCDAASQFLMSAKIISGSGTVIFATVHGLGDPDNDYYLFQFGATSGVWARVVAGSYTYRGAFTYDAGCDLTSDYANCLMEITPGSPNAIKVRVWQDDGTTEPATWGLNTTDSALTLSSGSNVAILGNTGATKEALVSFVSAGKSGSAAPRS